MARLSRTLFLGPVLGAVLVLVPSAVQACSVCFGQSEDPAMASIKIAVFTLMGFTGTVLTGVAGFIIQLRRRARRFNDRQHQAPAAGGD